MINLLPEKGPLFYQIYHYFKDEIRSQRLEPGTFLPAIRKCSRTLKVSKNTVETAYQLLLSEGYIVNRPRKGYQVLNIKSGAPGEAVAPSSPRPVMENRRHHLDSPLYDFKYGSGRLSDFPFVYWSKLRNEIIRKHKHHYDVVGHPQGEWPLREELARLLHQTRGIIASPEQIVIGATPQQLVSLICQLLNRESSVIAVENPGYDGARLSFVNFGFDVKGIPLADNGMEMTALRDSKATIAYVSPSQQFVHKLVMPLSKRLELIRWLQNAQYIIEDDYEWEFKYDERPVPAIHSLDQTGKVLYIGSISKALLPVFHLSYMVLPFSLVPVFQERITEYDQPVSILDQLTFCNFVKAGYWLRHVQKMRRLYKRKRELLFQAVTEKMEDKATIQGKDIGLHLFVTIHTSLSEYELINRALAAGVQVYPTSRYWMNHQEPHPTVLLGYGAMEEEQMMKGVEMLAKTWFG